jgi:hypothetical protein
MGEKYFSKIDLMYRYHQVQIKHIDVWKIAFNSKEVIFEWFLMPFGLVNSLATFMRMMDNILQPFTSTYVDLYLDEIIIYNNTWVEHLQYIQHFMHTLQHHKLYENLEKYSFSIDKVHYIVYIVDHHGVHVDPTKI